MGRLSWLSRQPRLQPRNSPQKKIKTRVQPPPQFNQHDFSYCPQFGTFFFSSLTPSLFFWIDWQTGRKEKRETPPPPTLFLFPFFFPPGTLFSPPPHTQPPPNPPWGPSRNDQGVGFGRFFSLPPPTTVFSAERRRGGSKGQRNNELARRDEKRGQNRCGTKKGESKEGGKEWFWCGVRTLEVDFHGDRGVEAEVSAEEGWLHGDGHVDGGWRCVRRR